MNEINSLKSRQHKIEMTDRKQLNITGVSDVDSFDEESVIILLDNCELIIKGYQLHISRLNVENGELTIDGEVQSLSYTDSRPAGGILKRIFR